MSTSTRTKERPNITCS